jgi:DNA-binding transcriptional MerR regulator
MYPIGRFAKLTRVTAKALQIYERHGLLKPRRTRAGYRRYTMREVQQLEHVLALRALGLSLKQVRVLTADTARLGEVLTQQRAALEDKRERIDRGRGGPRRRPASGRPIAPAPRGSPCSARSRPRSAAIRPAPRPGR